ncbi:type II toxin-antitoxin system VapC family toxin [Marinimicrobium sp. C6131]|uniref:type II toxin-antitoxin system VapC family toxin n=1 Tax=Marinimicrobium sp. C6131 TaxID=3022676 RepID=UPI00223D8993|nr:type II toxin-antitoxin system VapC family toxin [Marinimicrobium sp. C6131]UZJ45105.1 type II toxin-antitoxin system VapC family toxin [Marinimicrobium sp. C6131]
MYLLDTNIISELRKAASGRADAGVVQWADEVSPELLYLSAISVLELELGVLRIERKDKRQGAVLRRWLEEQVLPEFQHRILPVDEAVARRCAHLHTPDPQPERDALIAATAQVHQLTLVTRNERDFEGTGTVVLNPFSQ